MDRGILNMTLAFMAVIIGFMVLLIVVILRHKKKVEMSSAPFPQVIQKAAAEAVPETADFEKILVAGVKDTVQALKGYERIQSGYDSLPNYIVCYKGDEIYIMTAWYSGRKEIKVDMKKIMHITKEQIQEIKVGGGKVLIFFKESKMFFAMGVMKVLIAPQTEAYDSFMDYINRMAAEVNHG